MTQFNPDKKDILTYAETLGPVMNITDQEDADNYMEHYINYLCRKQPEISIKEHIGKAKLNIGYYAGYFDIKIRSRVEKLFKCEHPVFGSVEKNGSPSVQKALKLGIEYGKRMAKERI